MAFIFNSSLAPSANAAVSSGLPASRAKLNTAERMPATTANGTPIRNLRHLVETLRNSKEQYVEVEFTEKHVETLVFKRQEVLHVWKRLMLENGIRQPSSADLRKVWQPEGL